MFTIVENVVKADAADFPVTIAIPELKPGEKLAGVIISADGKYRHCLILLPEEAEENTWPEQMKWAASLGGDLPDRFESALLFATLRDEFKPERYWTCEQHAATPDYAWMLYFGDGYQFSYHESSGYRARAVRREKI